MRAILYLGRWLFAAPFIMAGYTHFTAATRAYGLTHGVPPWLTALAGLEACVGGLCVATGWRAREGACLIAGFLMPVTLVMHRFWGLPDPQQASLQMIDFIKNAALCGAALMIVYQGSAAWGGAQPATQITRRRRTRLVRPPDLVSRRG